MLCYVMLCYVMLRYATLCYVTLCYVMLCYVTLCYVMLCYVILYYVMLCYVMLCYVTLGYAMLCYDTLHYVMICYVMMCYVMSSHIMSRHFTSHHVASRHIMSRHVTSRHVMSCHVMSSHVMSCHVRDWCSNRRLQLNADKTEFIVFGSKANLECLNQADVNLRLDSAVIHPSESVRGLGVQLDSHLTMRDHIAKIASSCFYHLRRLRQLRRIADQSMLQRLVSAFVLSRIGYCNSVLAGLPHTTLAPLQRVLHAVVRFVAGLGPRDHLTDSMKALHCLPVPYRIKFKQCVLVHEVVIGTSPFYIKDLLTPTKDIAGRFNLRRRPVTSVFRGSGWNLDVGLSPSLDPWNGTHCQRNSGLLRTGSYLNVL